MMRRRPSIMLMQAVSGLLAATSVVALPVPAAEPSWEVVPEQQLAELRGGVDLGPLVASFAIQRVVEIDGTVVARMQIVIGNLDNLGNGGAPSISISGPVAQLVQIMNASGVAAAARAAQTLGTSSEPAGLAADSSPALSATRSGAGLVTNERDTAGTVTSGANAGSVSATGTGSGSTAQFGNAINTAVAAANTSPLSSTAGASGSAAPSAAASVTAAPASSASAASAPASVAAAPAASTSPSIAQTSPAGNGVVPAGTPIIVLPAASSTTDGSDSTKTIALNNGQVVVLSNLPNAAAITTAVQNQVRAATIQTQTIISATINSLGSLNALTLANQIRQQVTGGP